MSVWRLSGHRPVTLAFLRTLSEAVLEVVMGRVGSLGKGFPKGGRRTFGASIAELLPVPDGVLPQDQQQGNRPAFSGLCLASAHDQMALRDFDTRSSVGCMAKDYAGGPV